MVVDQTTAVIIFGSPTRFLVVPLGLPDGLPLFRPLKNVFYSSWLALTDPADVARVESKTVISTTNKHDTVPVTKEGVKGVLGNWIAPDDLDSALNTRFPGCMKGVFRLSLKHL